MESSLRMFEKDTAAAVPTTPVGGRRRRLAVNMNVVAIMESMVVENFYGMILIVGLGGLLSYLLFVLNRFGCYDGHILTIWIKLLFLSYFPVVLFSICNFHIF